MLANVPIEVSVLPGKIGDAADQVGLLHINGDLMGQLGYGGAVLGVPESCGGVIDGIGAWVPRLGTVDSHSPACLADTCCLDLCHRGGGGNLGQGLTIEGRRPFTGRLALS